MKQQWERNSNCQTGHCWTRQICSTRNFLTHTASKKDDFELSKLEEPLDSLTRGAWTNNPSVKNITKLPVWNNHDKDKCFRCPVDFISISFTSLKARKEVQSWFILRLHTAQITWNVIPHVIDSYVPGDHWVFITRAVCNHYWIQSTKYQLKSAMTWSTCPVRWLSGGTRLFCHRTPSSAPLILSPPSSALKLLSALITVSRREDCLDRSEAGGAASAQLTPDKPQPPPACGRGLCDPQLNKRHTTFFFFYIS